MILPSAYSARISTPACVCGSMSQGYITPASINPKVTEEKQTNRNSL